MLRAAFKYECNLCLKYYYNRAAVCILLEQKCLSKQCIFRSDDACLIRIYTVRYPSSNTDTTDTSTGSKKKKKEKKETNILVLIPVLK